MIGKQSHFFVCAPDREITYRNPFELLTLLCYPLTKQKGEHTYQVELQFFVDDRLNFHLAQSYMDVSDISALDMDLVRFHIEQNIFDPPSELEELSKTYPDRGFKARVIKLNLKAWRI